MVWFLSILLWLLPQPGFSGLTSISGHSPGYAGVPVVFYEYTEGVFNTKNVIFEFTPDEKGYFHSDFEIDKTTCLYSETGALIFYFYAEPGKSYKLNLPERRVKTAGEIRNPYFIPSLVHLPVEVLSYSYCRDINEAIREYDAAFDPFYSQQVLRYYLPEYSREKVDSFLIAVKQEMASCDPDYFDSYIFYKTGLLEFTVSEFNMNDIISRYFLDKQVNMSVSSYWELFNKVFDKYFGFLTNKEEYRELYKCLAGANFTAIENLLRNDPVLVNDTIRGLVFLNEIHNEFHAGYFSVTVLSALLDSLYVNSGVGLIRDLASVIKNRNLRLLPGSEVPDLLLTDREGRCMNINELQGNFIYLGFCHPDLGECQRELEYLRYYHQRFKDRLIIITVLDDATEEDLIRLSEEYDYGWMMAVLSEPEEAFRDFNIRGFPAFFFIGPDQRFIQSPATLPSAGFEKVLISTLRGLGRDSGL